MSTLSFAAVGDIAFEGLCFDRPSANVFLDASPILKSADLTIANLENPLTEAETGVERKFTLRGDPGWARIVKDAGIDLVTLANNHTMDYGHKGLFDTIHTLNLAGLAYLGAGRNREEACAPKFMEIKGMRLAILARTSVIVTSPSYAGDTQPGVAFLEPEETKKTIKSCKKEADIVVLLIHWGLEEYLYPTSYQRHLSMDFIEVGADLILGHHPHVLQGVERIGNGLVCYSLGTFVFADHESSFIDRDGQPRNHIVRLSIDDRKGGILQMSFSGENIKSYKFFPTFLHSNGIVKIKNTLKRQRDFSRLCSRLHWPAYAFLWRLYSLRMEWKLRIKPMTIGRLKWANLKKLRKEQRQKC